MWIVVGLVNEPASLVARHARRREGARGTAETSRLAKVAGALSGR